MDFEMRPTTKTENMYTFNQSQQITSQTGCIGHLRADMDSDGKGFFSTWFDRRSDLKTDEFKHELDDVINGLRFDSSYGDVLKDRQSLEQYCHAHEEARMNKTNSFGFRIDTQDHTYMLRMTPNAGEYNLYCYCYKKDWLDRHMQEAEQGIRFIDSSYNDKFRLPDGGQICITDMDGHQRDYTCRFIDPYHLEVGSGAFNLYHICEFAERMEQNGSTIQPLDFMPGKGVLGRDENQQFQIYQLKDTPEGHELSFLSLESARRYSGKDIDFANYELVYQDRLTAGVSLDDLYMRFNVDRPRDFAGHSLSVSDIIVVTGSGKDEAYYVDSIGFAEIPCPKDREMQLPEKYAKEKKSSVHDKLRDKKEKAREKKPPQKNHHKQNREMR